MHKTRTILLNEIQARLETSRDAEEDAILGDTDGSSIVVA